ncbi:MAG TPA: SH3 domain-containing protein [Scandinavium sp.]|jgi:hypothetical protein
MNNNDSNPSGSSISQASSERASESTDHSAVSPKHRGFSREDILNTPLFKNLNKLNSASLANHPLVRATEALNNSPAVKAMVMFQKKLAANNTSVMLAAQKNSRASRIMCQISESARYYDNIVKSLSRQAIPAANRVNRIANDYQLTPRISRFFDSWPSSEAGQRAIKFAEQMQILSQRTTLASIPLERTFRTFGGQGYLNSAQYKLAIRCWEDALAGLTPPKNVDDGVDDTGSYAAGSPASYEQITQHASPPCPENAPDEFSSLLSNQVLADGFKKLPKSVQVLIGWLFFHIILSMIEDGIKAAMLDGINAVKTEFMSPSKPATLRKSTIVTSHPDIHWEDLNHFRFITGENVRLRASPSMNSATIEMLNKGTVVAIMDTQGRQWLYVQVDCAGEKVYGWINRSYTSRLRN